MEENTADIPVDNEEPVAPIIEEQPKSILKPRKRTEKQREAFKKCQEGRAKACAERKQNPVSRKKKVNVVPQVVYLPPQPPESESESEVEEVIPVSTSKLPMDTASGATLPTMHADHHSNKRSDEIKKLQARMESARDTIESHRAAADEANSANV